MVKSSETNTTKYESYAEAWRRMKAAIDAGFYLEAIAIQESIIFDRLRSFVEHATGEEVRDDSPYSKLIKRLEAALNKDAGKEKRWDNDKELVERLKKWGDRRNRAVHRIVRSKPGTPTQPIDEFLAKVQETADRGAILAREVSDWFREQKKR
jgi:hypothetical protein